LLPCDTKDYPLIGVKLKSEGVDLNQLRDVVNKKPVTAFYGIPFHQNKIEWGISKLKDRLLY
jgi:hypothetical protein